MSEKRNCFVIQPFDAKYNKRYKDTYKKAIEKAGLNPFRADENYTPKKFKILVIEETIKGAAVCLADISEDNPNVWYELGFASGHDIPVVYICEKTTRQEVPFDINQQDIYFYETASEGDWGELGSTITNRLQTAAEQKTTPHEIHSDKTPKSAHQTKFGIIEKIVLHSLNYNLDGNRIRKQDVTNAMEGKFEEEDIAEALNILMHEKLVIEIATNSRTGAMLHLTKKGRAWCIENKDELRNVKTKSIHKK